MVSSVRLKSRVCGLPSCQKTTASHCKRCWNTCYCSRECQKADWPAHKHGCYASVDFLRFPKEIRDRIYELALAKHHLIAAFCSLHGDFVEALRRLFTEDPDDPQRPPPRGLKRLEDMGLGILLANKKLSKEAKAVFYAKNSFRLDCKEDWRYFYAFLRFLGPTRRRYLRNVEILMWPPLSWKQKADGTRDLSTEGRPFQFADRTKNWTPAPAQPDDPYVDTLDSSLAYCFAGLGSKGSRLRLRLECTS